MSPASHADTLPADCQCAFAHHEGCHRVVLLAGGRFRAASGSKGRAARHRLSTPELPSYLQTSRQQTRRHILVALCSRKLAGTRTPSWCSGAGGPCSSPVRWLQDALIPRPGRKRLERRYQIEALAACGAQSDRRRRAFGGCLGRYDLWRATRVVEM
jgi:hypothetical protein